jgi:ABC-type phosphate/phosphonate transport system substrate-binding protein
MSPARGSEIGRLLSAVVLLVSTWSTTPAQERLTFIGVALDSETRQADSVLRDYLHRTADVQFAPEELEYGRVIDRLANWNPEAGDYLARTTPYVYVAAEMLGADFEILATYISSTTGDTTYNSYFVIGREHFDSPPDLDDLFRFLRQSEAPARFVYHSKFSTSSYFLPSLYFRDRRIFNMPENTETLVAIESKHVQARSSTELVKMVARGEADLAAIFDGTRAKFGQDSTPLAEEFGDRVYFIQLPTKLPNDLLVCSGSLDAKTKERLRSAFQSMGPDEVEVGDFRAWELFKNATDSRVALANLRWLARERETPITVEVRFDSAARRDADATGLLSAVRQAVRLSGSEFIVYDQDFHEHIDFTWTVEPIHDGAILLHSAISGSDIDEQVFQLSFRDLEGLTRRIGALIQNRLHRIRYVWPYSDNPPIVLRDTPSGIPPGTAVKVQRVTWLDPERNKFRAGAVFDARVTEAGFHKYVLAPHDFPGFDGRAIGVDAMSNETYRVILVNESHESPVFKALTVAFLALLVGAAGAFLLDLRRPPRDNSAPRRRNVDSSDDTRTILRDEAAPETRRTSTPSSGSGTRPGRWH